MAAHPPLALRTHGGPDHLGVPLHDFSSNSNACGPCPAAWTAVQQADARQYPDASYTALRAQLAAFHGVDPRRVLLAGSASEFIFRITALAVQRGASGVWLPPHSYGDYAQAAQAWKLPVVAQLAQASLRWACDPSSPHGAAYAGLGDLVNDEVGKPAPAIRPYDGLTVRPELVEGLRQAQGERTLRIERSESIIVLDRAYEPLRLSGALALPDEALQKFWQLWTPNKALGLTGVRAAYVIAPLGANDAVMQLESLAPSWPVGAHGVAMLRAWCEPAVQQWLADSLVTLREWKERQKQVCESIGWTVLPSNANFFVCHAGIEELVPDSDPGTSLFVRRYGLRIKPALTDLRERGIKLRDCTSFGLSGHLRLSVQTPAAQDALHHAWKNITKASS